jgi:hypothetical protein
MEKNEIEAPKLQHRSNVNRSNYDAPSLCANVIKFCIRETVMRRKGANICSPPQAGVTTRIPIIAHSTAEQFTHF